MPDKPTEPKPLESKPEEEREWPKPPEEETDPSKLVDIADPTSAPEEGAY
jgi:hypothetical protein